MKRLTAALLALACAQTAGGPGAFRDAGDPRRVGEALARGGSPARGVIGETGAPMVYLAGADRLLAFDLAARAVRWDVGEAGAGRLVVSGPAVVFARRGGPLVGRDVRTGRELWARERAGVRVGYTASADAVFEATHAAGRPREVELVAVDARSGRTRWRVSLEGEAGAPVARAGLVALPRRSQYVTLIDARSGEVLADILSREEAATFVRGLPEGLFYGSRGIHLASPETAAGARAGGGYLRPKVPPELRTFLEHDLYRPEQLDHSALDRNRVLWRVVVDGPRAAFADGVLVVHSFRFFFGLDAGSGELRWAHRHPGADAVASTRVGGAVLFAAADGELGALDVRDGRRSWTARLPGAGLALRGGTFDAEGFMPGGAGAPAPPLARTLADILWDKDRRFLDIKTYVVDRLAALPGREAAEALVRVLSAAADLPAGAVDRAADALAARRDPASGEVYARALAARGDWAEERPPPRLDVLARAVAASGARGALPALLGHLAAPDTEPAVVRVIADAALALDAPEAAAPFEDFLVQHRADPRFAAAPVPLIAAADVVMKLGGPDRRPLLLFVAEDPRTVEPLRTHLQAALGGRP